jgi:hypothetical protein
VITGQDGSFQTWVLPGVYDVTVTAPAALLLEDSSFSALSIPGGLPSRIVLERREPPPPPPVFAVRFAPNPWRGDAVISLTLPAPEEDVLVGIYDLTGRRVRTLHEGALGEGETVLAWTESGGGVDRVVQGVYFLRVETSDRQMTKKIVRVR